MSFVASSSQNCRKSDILRISIDRSVKGDSLRANSKSRPQIRLSLGDESPHDEFMRSKALLPLHLRGRRGLDNKIVGFVSAPMKWFVISMFWAVFCVPSFLLRPPAIFRDRLRNSATTQLSSHCFRSKKQFFLLNHKTFQPRKSIKQKECGFSLNQATNYLVVCISKRCWSFGKVSKAENLRSHFY